MFIRGNDYVDGLTFRRIDHVDFGLSDTIVVEGDLGDILIHPTPGLSQNGLHDVMCATIFGRVR